MSSPLNQRTFRARGDRSERRRPTSGPRKGPLRVTVPSRNDGFLRSLVGAIGGPLGKRTAPGMVSPGFWRIERVLLVLVIVAGLVAVLTKTTCRAQGWGDPYRYVGMCYSDWTALWGARGFAETPWAPFDPSQQPFEYPAGMSVIASLVSLLVPRGWDPQHQILLYFDINTLLAVTLWAVVVMAVAKMSSRRIWDAALVAVSPAIILALTVNWDMWAVALMATGLLALGRQHPWLGGILLGLGAAVKLFPILILGAIFTLAWRTGRWAVFGKVAGGAAAGWLILNVPVMAVGFNRWATFYTFSSQRGAGLSSTWELWDNSIGILVPSLRTTPDVISALGVIIFGVWCLIVLALGYLAPHRPRVAQLSFLIVAMFVLIGKVYSPQFVMWLVPLAVLAYPRWRALLAWQLFEVLHFMAIWMRLYMDAVPDQAQGRFPDVLYGLAVLGHIVSLALLMAVVVHTIIRPEADPVRRVGLDDPLGGLFAESAHLPAPTAREEPSTASDSGHPVPVAAVTESASTSDTGNQPGPPKEKHD